MMEYNAYGKSLTEEEIASGKHREFVGGMWDEIGRLQFEFLIEQGLQPHMRLLDIGCGCLRGGIHFIRYLNNGNYYGMDANDSLLQAGYDEELYSHGLQGKLPLANLICSESFQFDRFQTDFNIAMAQSLFTHLPLNQIRLCLINLCAHVNSGAKFYATYFECPVEWRIESPLTHNPGGVVTHCAKDPYHYYFRDLQYCAEGLPWQVQNLGDWKHPRGQRMCLFTKK
jgi:hypothetical protein